MIKTIYIVVKYQINLHSLQNRVEQPVSKAHANTYKCIFQQCTYVVYFFRSPTSQHVSKGEQVKDAVCEIIGRPIDNVYVKSSWSISNFQTFVYTVQWVLCKI